MVAVSVLGCSAMEDSPSGGVAGAAGGSGAAGAGGGGATGAPRPPAEWSSADFIDVHTHCGQRIDCDGQRCCDFSGWTALNAKYRARAIMLANEYWLINADIAPPIKDAFEGLNDHYLLTAKRQPNAQAFVGLRCLYRDQVDDGWADKCKREAADWVKAGALGFKDHNGKQWDADGPEAGQFVAGWNRLNGFCSVQPGSQTPNSDCMAQSTVRYLALDPSWREVVRYIVDELKVPIVSHLATFQGADTKCYDPGAKTMADCGPLTVKFQQKLAEWVGQNTSEAGRRRLIIAHTGFVTADEAALRALLDTGVSVDTARLDNFARAGCAARALVAAYPKQVMFGTDRRMDQACLPRSYDAWLHIFDGPADEERMFNTCQGMKAAKGWALSQPTVAGCPDVPDGALDAVLRTNFLSLYE